jgi:hypothetical protein
VRQTSAKAGYDVIGANRELAGAEVELVGSNGASVASGSTHRLLV